MIGDSKPVLGFTFQSDINDKATVGFTSHVDRDCSQAELDALMDKTRLAVERQKKFVRLEGLKKDVENFSAQAEVIQRALETLDSKYAEKAAAHTGRGEYAGMNKTEAAQRQETIQNLEYHKLGADKARREIEALENELRIDRVDPYAQAAE